MGLAGCFSPGIPPVVAVRWWLKLESSESFLTYMSGSWAEKAGIAGGWSCISLSLWLFHTAGLDFYIDFLCGAWLTPMSTKRPSLKCKASSDLDLKVTQCHFYHMLLIKVNHRGIPDLRDRTLQKQEK